MQFIIAYHAFSFCATHFGSVDRLWCSSSTPVALHVRMVWPDAPQKPHWTILSINVCSTERANQLPFTDFSSSVDIKWCQIVKNTPNYFKVANKWWRHLMYSDVKKSGCYMNKEEILKFSPALFALACNLIHFAGILCCWLILGWELVKEPFKRNTFQWKKKQWSLNVLKIFLLWHHKWF